MKFIITSKNLPAKKNDIEISCRGKYPVKYKSQKLKDFEKEVMYQLIAQKRKWKLPLEEPLEVYYRCYLNHRFNNRDIDNIVSTLSDVLQDNEIITNDALIIKSIGEKFLIPKEEIERAEIEIQPYEAEIEIKPYEVDKQQK